MHFCALNLPGIKTFKRPVAIVLVAVFLAIGLFNTRIIGEFASRVSAYVQTHTQERCLLESPLRWQQGTGVSQVLLSAAVSPTAVLTILLFSAVLPSAVLPLIRRTIPDAPDG